MIGAFTRSARLHSGSVVDAPFREDRSLEEIAAGMLLSIALATSGGSETTMNEDGTITLGTDNTVSTVFASGAVFGGVVAALGTWVLFGWFQHTLRMLALSAGLSLRANPPAYVQPPLQAAP